MAVAIPDIGPLVSLVGSVGFSMLGLIVPVFMETVWYWSDENDDGQEQDFCDGTTVTGESGTTAAVDGGPATTAVVSAGGAERRALSRGNCCHRFIRHVKNLILFLLGLLALVGGAFYNVRDIIARASGDSLSPNI